MKQLLFLFLLMSIKSFSQSIEIGNIHNINQTFFLEEKEQLYVFQKDSLSIIDVNKLEEISKKGINYPSNTVFYAVSINSEIYFIDGYGGKVYKLDDENFIRIDNSFSHRMQMSAPTFTFNNII